MCIEASLEQDLPESRLQIHVDKTLKANAPTDIVTSILAQLKECDKPTFSVVGLTWLITPGIRHGCWVLATMIP